MNFNFGSNTPKTTTGAILGTSATPTTSATGFSLGTPTANTGLTFGAGTPTGVSGIPLGGAGDSSKSSTQTAAVKPIVATTPVSLGTAPITSSSTTGFSGFGWTQTTSSAAPPTSTPGFSFGPSSIPTPATTPSTISFSLTSTTTTAPKLSSTITPSLVQTTTSAATAPTALSTITSVTPATVLSTNTLTFVQLEETINKWNLELEEHEKIFTSQAKQISNWDSLLNSNSEKIESLHTEVTNMKLQQQQLEHEMDFILAQQRELEDVLVPLEKETADLPSHSDPEREHTYHMAETLDTQVKQMSEDLRDIIEHLNESSQTQDNTDPIVQIGRILNAHMNSLHWIDQMTLNIQNQLDNVTKLHDIHRRENERSFRITYE